MIWLKNKQRKNLKSNVIVFMISHSYWICIQFYIDLCFWILHKCAINNGNHIEYMTLNIQNIKSHIQINSFRIIQMICIVMLFIFIALFPNVPQTSWNRLHFDLLRLLCLSSLKLECEKLASEKVEIQRHYVMVRKEKI